VDKKEEFYRWVRMLGFASFIPVVLISGPIAGYFIGDFLDKHYHAKHFTLILVLLGLVSSLFETARVIRAMIRIEKRRK